MPSASAAPVHSAASDPLPIPSRFEPSPPLEPAASGVAVAEHGRWLTVSGRWYSLSLPADEALMNRSPYAVLLSEDGNNWTDICLLSSVHRSGVPDESYGLGAVELRDRTDDAVTLVIPANSTAWETRELRLRCTPETIEVAVTVRGSGDLDDVVLFGGSGTLRSGAGGDFRSSIGFRSVFVPVPTEPVAFVRPARASATLGVVGDADPGRLHGIFSPPPLVLGLGRRDATGPTHVPGGGWLGLAARAAVQDLTFTTLRYEPMDAGFWLRLSYEGHTPVAGEWTSPELVLRPADDAWSVIEDSRTDLVDAGFAPAPPERGPDWWEEPMFCGWGAQCARSAHALHGTPDPRAKTEPETPLEEAFVVLLAPQLARETAYDDFLRVLAANDLDPGTIVIDDRWQAQYGTATPDLGHWPDLKGWIADRHAEGRKVLLWWKAWDPAGLPADECVLDPAGRPVAVDPGSAAYLSRLERIVADLLSPDGLDADGFKVDFTQRTPSGRALRGTPGVWGVAALHRLLRGLYTASKAAKPDALVITHAVHPSFGDVGDMVRLNDVLRYDVSGHPAPVADQVVLRQGIARAAMPGHVIDTDQWPMPDRAEWLRYAGVQHRLGVPALYYAEAIDRSGEPIRGEDLAVVADTWREYRRRLADRRAAGR
ncbi:hypothetical protein [Naasia sp. SYSU D00057]|uniref:hypothetical protein n=1 Tax=Naasia sp. SYSU D00057 TaxID=2817380 RepID=UPI001B3178BB|nr:hypothetical protein [Naasia sp. SYSU D00057]